MIERNIFVASDRRIEPISVVYGSSRVEILLHIMDCSIPLGAVAVAHARSKSTGKTYENPCSIVNNSISILPLTGFFQPGTNVLQVDVAVGELHIISFLLDVLCTVDLATGTEPVEAEQILPMLERAEEILRRLESFDSITEQEINEAYNYGLMSNYQVIDSKEY